MDFFKAVETRRSVRSYQRRDVEEEKLTALLRSANAAPSAGNLQAYDIVVVRDAQAKQALCDAALGQTFVAKAPVVLVFLQNPARAATVYGKRGVELYSSQDTAIACAYVQLAATSLGLATCWVGAFHPGQVSRLIKAPSEMTPVALLPVGYGDEMPQPTGRRHLEDLVHWESF
jgi:nitroreductase